MVGKPEVDRVANLSCWGIALLFFGRLRSMNALFSSTDSQLPYCTSLALDWREAP